MERTISGILALLLSIPSVLSQSDFQPQPISFPDVIGGLSSFFQGIFDFIISNIGYFADPGYLAGTLAITLMTYISFAIFTNVANNQLSTGGTVRGNKVNKFLLADNSYPARGKLAKANFVMWFSILTTMAMIGFSLDAAVGTFLYIVAGFVLLMLIALALGFFFIGTSAVATITFATAGGGSKGAQVAYNKAYKGSPAQKFVQSGIASISAAGGAALAGAIAGGAALAGAINKAKKNCPSCGTTNWRWKDKCKSCGNSI